MPIVVEEIGKVIHHNGARNRLRPLLVLCHARYLRVMRKHGKLLPVIHLERHVIARLVGHEDNGEGPQSVGGDGDADGDRQEQNPPAPIAVGQIGKDQAQGENRNQEPQAGASLGARHSPL